MAKTRRRAINGISDAALEKLIAYPWPGNVRELENVVERMTVFCMDAVVELDDLPTKIVSPPARPGSLSVDLPEEGLDLREVLNEFEERLIRQALDRTGWNKNRAAALLNMNRTTLVEKLKKRGMLKPDGED
tara:strand:- start:54 stop:449 length:396 start_codon:yes stop_codon:yes gene_type:complete